MQENGYKCLIIEDSHVQAKVISLMLGQCGWNVFIASNLSDACSAAKNDNFELILADLVLPDATSGQSINKMRELSPNSLIVAMSASDQINRSDSVLQKAKANGASFLLSKPFTIDRLRPLLEEVEFRIETNERLPHILVVDDSQSIRKICHNILSEIGYRITLAETMSEALDKVDLFDLDIILSDLHMPGIEPGKAIPAIRKAIPLVGIIAMSGNVDEELQRTLLNGADAIVSKPFDVRTLVEAIENILQNRATRPPQLVSEMI